MREPQPTTIHLRDYTPPAFLIERVALDVDIRDADTLVKARLEVLEETFTARPGRPKALA